MTREWVVAIVTGIAGGVLLAPPGTLADPPLCPGLLELAGIVATRTARDTPLADMVLWTNRVTVAIGLALFVRLLQLRGRDLTTAVSAVAAAAGLFFTPIVAPVLAPSPAAALAAASGAMLAWISGRALVALACLLLLVAIVPVLLVPAIAIAAWAGFRRGGVVAPLAAAGVLVAGVVAVSIAAPPIAILGGPQATALGCAMPLQDSSLATFVESQRKAFGATSPYAIALAVLGAFIAPRAWHGDGRRWPFVSFAIVPAVAAASPLADPLRTLAPAAVGFWALAGLGLGEFLRAINFRRLHWIVAPIAVAALPWLQASHVERADVASADVPRGHEQLSRQRFLQIVSGIAPGSALVVEDALVSILVPHASRRLATAGHPITLVTPEVEAMTTAIASGRVFAFPRAQTLVQHEGFRVREVEAHIDGLAEVSSGAPCEIVTAGWHDASALTQASGFALVGRGADARGPVVLYLSNGERLAPEKIEWPLRAGRGFDVHEYDLDREGDGSRLQRDAAADAAPAGHRVFQGRHVARIEIWRVPGAPPELPVSLAHPPGAVLVAPHPNATPGVVRLCPSFGFRVVGF